MKLGIIDLVCTQTQVCAQGGKKCQFFGKFCVRINGMFPALKDIFSKLVGRNTISANTRHTTFIFCLKLLFIVTDSIALLFGNFGEFCEEFCKVHAKKSEVYCCSRRKIFDFTIIMRIYQGCLTQTGFTSRNLSTFVGNIFYL